MIIKKVRLSAHNLQAIESSFLKHFLQNDALWLFGSRTDLNRKGGDIDLYIETQAESTDAAIKMQWSFLEELENKIGEQKIDIVLNLLNFPHPLPIHDVAKKEGVKIV